MKIAIEGCAHGELEKIYECIETLQQREGLKIDLLICCGDFQSVRNGSDLRAMAVPEKYQHMCTFYKYYNGEKHAPILTLFIGGNHEASNYLQELPYGGWVAPNIYYIGRAGVVKFGDLRIGGMSGIFKGHDYLQGFWERVPYMQKSLRSVYHVRSLDVFRLSQLKEHVHIMLSHDWPRGITQFGDQHSLLMRKPFFRQDIESNELGSPPAEKLLNKLQPDYWFAAHLHVQFAALVKHDNNKETKFLALDKCLPKRRHLQIVDIPEEFNGDKLLKYDEEWLAVLKSSNHLTSVKNIDCHLPGPGGNERFDFTPTTEEKEAVIKLMGDMVIREDSFVQTAPVYDPNAPKCPPSEPLLNPQTENLCEKLGIDDPVQLIMARMGQQMKRSQIDDKAASNLVSTPLKCTKLSLPAPVTPSETDENLSQKLLSPDSNLILDTSYDTSECSTPVLEGTKKIFKRRNMSMYNNTDMEETASTSSSLLEADSPSSNKYPCLEKP